MLVQQPLSRREIPGWRDVHAFALDRLDQQGRDVASAQLASRSPRDRRTGRRCPAAAVRSRPGTLRLRSPTATLRSARDTRGRSRGSGRCRSRSARTSGRPRPPRSRCCRSRPGPCRGSGRSAPRRAGPAVAAGRTAPCPPVRRRARRAAPAARPGGCGRCRAPRSRTGSRGSGCRRRRRTRRRSPG